MKTISSIKGKNYFTDILDKLSPDSLLENIIENNKNIELFKIITPKPNSEFYIFKTVKCQLKDTDIMSFTENDYYSAVKMYDTVTYCTSKPLDMKKYIDRKKDFVQYEMLFEGGCENLYENMLKADGPEIYNLSQKILKSLLANSQQGVYFTNLHPENIYMKNGKMVFANFICTESAKEFSKKFAILNTKNLIICPQYAAPELWQELNDYSLEKVIVYAWGILIYQLSTLKSDKIILEEAQKYRQKGGNYKEFIENNIKKLEFAYDSKDIIGTFMRSILLDALIEKPGERPDLHKLFNKTFSISSPSGNFFL